ncbi:MAG: FtsX-like permease family protein [Armatimonadetes bacterium]|nr:FtsX-like permease family protein [Armatimonadota bacterium]
MTQDRLNLKLIRDLRASWRQFLSAGATVFLGTAIFIASSASYKNLVFSYQESYRKLNFMDFSIKVARAPRAVVARIRNIPGVRAAEGRLNQDIEVEQKRSQARKIIGRILSLPRHGKPSVNSLLVAEGAGFSEKGGPQVLLERTFARYHKYLVGDRIYPIASGYRIPFTVVGMVSSPEYIWVMRNREYIMPDPEVFGVLFVPEDEAHRLLRKPGTINEVLVCVDDTSVRPRVMLQSRRILAPYGIVEAIPREQQPSHELLDKDLQSFRALSFLFPFFFFTISGLSIYALLNRMLATQRPLIGILMAMGFPKQRILRHYLGFAVLVGLVGSLPGLIAGHFLGAASTRLYVSVLGIPYVAIRIHEGDLLVGLVLGLASTVLAGIFAVLGIQRLRPVEALYSEVSAKGRRPILEKLLPALSRLPFFWKVPLRNFFRSPRRTLFSVFGVAASVALNLMSLSFFDSNRKAIDHYFSRMLNYDLRVVFMTPQAGRWVHLVSRWPGVKKAETLLELPVKLERRGQTVSTLLFGAHPGGTMVLHYDKEGRVIELGKEGIVLGPIVKEKLDLEPGNSFLLSAPEKEGTRQFRHRVRFSREYYLPVGTGISWDLEEVRKTFKQELDLPSGALNSILLRTEEGYQGGIRKRLYGLPGVAAVIVLSDVKRQVDDLMKLFNVYLGIMFLFSAALAFAIVFGTTTMSILERSREMATLSTLGAPISWLLKSISVENGIIWALGFLAGIPLGRLLAHFMIAAYKSDYFWLEMVISLKSYLFAAALSLLVTLLAQLPALSYVRNMNLETLTRERSA